jgi:hypothetical protein
MPLLDADVTLCRRYVPDRSIEWRVLSGLNDWMQPVDHCFSGCRQIVTGDQDLREGFGSTSRLEGGGEYPARQERFAGWCRRKVVLLRGGVLLVQPPSVANLAGQAFRPPWPREDRYPEQPLARTAQTSQVVFNRAEPDQDWLYGGREQMLESMMQRKVSGRNLIQVTHSGCIQALQEELGYRGDQPAYGSALFIAAHPAGNQPLPLGFLEMDDWGTVLDF